MGDRGNIVIQDQDGGRVYLYTHWRGSDIKQVAREALHKKQRWDDAPYLARIVFDALTQGIQGETGYGISSSIGDNEHPVLVVDCGKQEVHFEDADGNETGAEPVSFNDFIK